MNCLSDLGSNCDSFVQIQSLPFQPSSAYLYISAPSQPSNQCSNLCEYAHLISTKITRPSSTTTPSRQCSSGSQR